MGNVSSKRTFDQASSDADDVAENISVSKHLKYTPISTCHIEKSTFQDLCTDIFLEIFQYLRPIDLLYSFTNLYPLLDSLIEPYTHTLDFRLISKSYFQCLTQSLSPCLTTNLRVLRLSNTHTFSQISDILYKFNWSQINQLESLTFDSIKSDELSRYFRMIHPLLEHLWRLSLTTFDEDDKLSEKLLIDHILTPQSESLKNCFLMGIKLDLSKSIGQKSNEHLRELTLTLSTINDLIILFRIITHLEILICTIIDSTCNDNIEKIQSLEFLTILTLTIKKPIGFKNLQKILIPHIKLKHLSLQAVLYDENSNQEIGGFELEKLFRTFSQLNELHFYLRHSLSNTHGITNIKPDHLYLFSFTSHFWVDRSIEVFTHYIPLSNQRYIYTLPFAFDKFHIVEDINFFFVVRSPYYYTNVRHLSLPTTSNLDECIYSNMILKFFPNIRTITFSDKPSSSNTIKILKDHQWILQKISSNTSTTQVVPYVYILNRRKSTQCYFRTLDVMDEDQRLFANNSKRVRQLTIFEMTEKQLVNLSYFFPWIHVLTLYVNASEWFSLSNDWLYHLLTSMTSLFSLTIYYPKDMEDKKLHDLLANTLLAVKKHFYIKCNDGILNIWF